MTKTRIASLSVFALALLPAVAPAQIVEPDVVDRLVAVVGDSVVVQTQVQEEIQRRRLQGQPVPAETDPAYDAFFREVLQQFVDQLLILQAAARDSLIQVDDAVIDERVNEQITQLTQQFGGQTALQQALAAESLTLAEYREIMRSEARTSRIQQLFMQARLRDAPAAQVSEDELRARFQEARGQLQQRPRTVTFHQVIVTPEASEGSVEEAREKALAILDSISAGEDFARLAEAHSDDPGSASAGGDLGWFRRGQMVREFEDAAFSLIDGQVSDLVETEYGFHIIKVERYRAGERRGRHILIVPEKTESDVERAGVLAESIAEEARAGTSMETLFERHGDPSTPDSLTVAFEQLSNLPEAYGQLRTASQGDVVGPLRYEMSPGETRFTVVRVDEIREAGAYTFEDLRGQIAEQLQQEKLIERVLEQLRASTYIDIRM